MKKRIKNRKKFRVCKHVVEVKKYQPLEKCPYCDGFKPVEEIIPPLD